MLKFLLFSGFILLMLASAAQITQQGGGEYKMPRSQCITQAQHNEIVDMLHTSLLNLQAKGIVPQTFSTEQVLFDFPLKQSPAYNYPSYYGISNYFDHNISFPNLITDYNCGTRSYDATSGYNHQGIDYFLWPFDNLMMQREQVQVIAAQAGTILAKSDGNFDQNCAFCTGCNWNAVFILHSDGSVAWYGHLKTNTLTAKAVGATVAIGEYLGAVGSSGNSSGPHLHFEVYKAQPYTNANLIDPYAGTCNTRNIQSWWQSQRPYNQPTINLIQTQTAPTSFNTCPTLETTNESNLFVQGQQIYYSAYYADQITGTTATYTVTRPDNSVYQTWTQNFTNSFTASWWWWTYTLPGNAPLGNWNFRAVYNSQTVNYPFVVTAATAVSTVNSDLKKIKIFPNPVQNIVNLVIEDWVKEPIIIINNMKGEIVVRKDYNQPTKHFTLELAFLPKGNYLVVVMDGTKKVAQQKLMK